MFSVSKTGASERSEVYASCGVEKANVGKHILPLLGLLSLLSCHPLLTELYWRWQAAGPDEQAGQRGITRVTHTLTDIQTWVCECSLPPNVTKIVPKNSDLVLKDRPSQIHFANRESSFCSFHNPSPHRRHLSRLDVETMTCNCA